MNNEKDTQKAHINHPAKGSSYISTYNSNSYENKGSSDFANKKTEKLITALYMVTDYMDSSDALRGKLRSAGVNLLSDIYKLPLLSPVEKHHHLNTLISQVSEISTFIHISYTIGFMSEMNANILKKEFHLLSEELKSYQQENKQVSMPAEMGFGGGIFENQKMSGFTLNEKMFEVESESIGDVVNSNLALKDSIKDNINKRTVSSLSFSKRVNYPNYIKTSEQRPSNESTKTERTQKIIDIIKDTSKKLGNASGDGVSIKEVSAFFKDCSEKTIQRELNDLVSKNKIKKIGAKRWSRYLPV
jgi:hypothetical protein